MRGRPVTMTAMGNQEKMKGHERVPQSHNEVADKVDWQAIVAHEHGEEADVQHQLEKVY